MRELDRVADEVDQDLAQPGDVADQDLRDGIIDDVGEVELLLGGLGRQQVERLLDAGMEFERMMLQLQLARLDLREIQDVVDDGQQGVGAAAGGLDILALFVGQFGVQQQGGHADHAVHRGADFMAHVGQELRLGQRGLLELLVERDQGARCSRSIAAGSRAGRDRRRRAGAGSDRRRMMPDAGDQLDAIRQFEQIIVGADAKAWPLTSGFSFVERTMIGISRVAALARNWPTRMSGDQRIVGKRRTKTLDCYGSPSV